MRYRRVIFLLGACLFLLCASSEAFVVPGRHMLEFMTGKIGKADTLKVSQRLVILGGKSGLPNTTINETLSYKYPNFFRIESIAENTHRIHVTADEAAVTILDNRCVSETDTILDRYHTLLFYRSCDVLEGRLALSGVNVTVSSIGRFEGRVCQVLGAQYPDLTSPQIWLEKETFIPIRWLNPETLPDGSKTLLEFRYLDWREKENLWFPMRIQLIEGNTLTREIVIDAIQVNPALDSALFNVNLLKKNYPGSVDNAQKEGVFEDSIEIQKTIEDFKKRYE